MPVARSTDPWTSWEAAERVDHITETQQAILALFRDFGSMTDEKLVSVYRIAAGKGEAPHAEPSGIRSRRDELTKAGLVHDTGVYLRGRTNRRMKVWAVGGAEQPKEPITAQLAAFGDL